MENANDTAIDTTINTAINTAMGTAIDNGYIMWEYNVNRKQSTSAGNRPISVEAL